LDSEKSRLQTLCRPFDKLSMRRFGIASALME
jgi:hypothetical protein